MAALLCLAAVAGVRADDFAALRAEAAGRTVRLAPGTQLEALVVSDYRSQNMELNPNVSWDKVDLGENLRTAYVENLRPRPFYKMSTLLRCHRRTILW